MHSNQPRHPTGTVRRSAARLRRVFERVGRVIMVSAMLLASGGALHPQEALAAPCDAPIANPIVCENSLAGTPMWDVAGSGDPTLQGFTADISYNKGDTVSFKVTSLAPYQLDIYRIGYYGGVGARKIDSVPAVTTNAVAQPACLTDPSGLIDCGNWSTTGTWAIPTTAVSGLYLGRLIRADTLGSTLVPFIVRDDAGQSAVLFQTSDTTWQAYNQYGGNSLYMGTGPGRGSSGNGRAFKVSYNRPFANRGQTPLTGQFGQSSYPFYAEVPMIRFLEANGYNVSYISGVDSDRNGSLLTANHKAILSVGHDEYWSGAQRANFEAAKSAGVNLAFFSGNTAFWRTRYEPSIDGSGANYRTLVSYKDSHEDKLLDPVSWTGSWRDPRFSPPAAGGEPENALKGTIFMVNQGSSAISVASDYSKMRIWRNTAAATLAPGAAITLGTKTLGYEWDVDADNGFRPGGLIQLSSTTVNNVPQYLQNFSSMYGAVATATHNLTMFRAAGGGLVFDAGSLQWSWGLDNTHDTVPGSDMGGPPDVNLQQATVNILADMGAQPGSLGGSLSATSASADHTAPTTSISGPTAGSHVADGTTVTITGTATDNVGGGVVGGVEVSVDGATWHRATINSIAPTTNWSYAWKVSSVPGPVTIRSRGIDDSANIETAGAGVSVTVDTPLCACSLYRPTDAPGPQGTPDTQGIEVGVKFRSDVAGYVNGVRFYKPSAATDTTHIGTLWSSTGQMIGQGKTTSETGSGWQQVTFNAPVQIAANTTYVVSYHADHGAYAVDMTTFGYAGADNWPLHILKNNVDGPNGVYAYFGAPTFPTQTFNASNYWVDVVFNTQAVDTVPPTVTGFTPADGTSNLALDTVVKATFSEPMRLDTQPGAPKIVLKHPSGAVVDGSTTYNPGTKTATFKSSGPLALNTPGTPNAGSYTATVTGQDAAGNDVVSPPTWNFSTPACPCKFWDDTITLTPPVSGDSAAVEVGVHFSTQVDGYITGLRFYKFPLNIGTHIGKVWRASDKSLLGSVTFGTETPSGWQTATFSPAIHVTPGTDYVVSYHSDGGNYAATLNYFTTDRVVGPLLAKASAAGAPNGVYAYGPGGYPDQSFGAANYWVDPIFNPTTAGVPALQISNAVATQVDQNNETIAWTTNNPSDTQVEYGTTTAYGLKSVLNTTQFTNHSLQLSGLTPNTTYHYLIHTRDSAGAEAPTTDMTFLSAPIPDTTPPVITNVQKIQVSSSSETIKWTTDELADTQLDYGLTSTYGTMVLSDTTTRVMEHSVSITNLSPSTTYHLQISGRDSSNNLIVLADDTFTTSDVQISAVNSQVASDQTGDTNASVSWTTDAPSDTQVEYGTTINYGSTTLPVSDQVITHTVAIGSLTPGTTYHYRVKSTANGHTATSGDFTFTTRDHVAPTFLVITATPVNQNTETITWTTNEAADTQVVYGATSAYGTAVPATADPQKVTSHTVQLSGLAPGTTYHYAVKSTDAAGNLATSADQTFTTIDQTPPQFASNPPIQAINVTPNSATITWTTTEASDSTVKFGTSTSYSSPSVTSAAIVIDHSLNLSGLTPNTPYHYQVLSKDASGNLATSTDRSFTTMPVADTTPPTFSLIQVTRTTNSVTITWTTNEESDTQAAYGATSSYGLTTTLVPSLTTTHSATITGLTANTTYHFQLRSKDAAKNLGVTPDATFTTAASPRSLSLNGTTGYAQAASASEINVVGDWTIETWFKDESTSGYNHLPTAILVKGDVVNDREIPFAIGIAFNSLFIAEKANNTFGYMYYDLAAHGISANAWHHLAVSIKSSTRQVTLYIDGNKVQQGTFSAVTTVGNTKPVSIGRNGGPGGYGNWKGKLDDLRIWTGVRPATGANSIASDYKEQISPTNCAPGQACLVANWKFDESSGTIAADSGATPQNATLYGGATWSSDVHTP